MVASWFNCGSMLKWVLKSTVTSRLRGNNYRFLKQSMLFLKILLILLKIIIVMPFTVYLMYCCFFLNFIILHFFRSKLNTLMLALSHWQCMSLQTSFISIIEAIIHQNTNLPQVWRPLILDSGLLIDAACLYFIICKKVKQKTKKNAIIIFPKFKAKDKV